MSGSPTQDSRSEQSAEQRRRKRKERAATSRAPEPKNIVSGAGQPLDPGVRRELEERLGHDLSRVRLHTGRDAGQLADLLGADAVAVGQDIFFGEGAYRPGTDEGRRLLAHELLHTIQNPHGLGTLRAGRDLGAVSLPQQAIEREAESAAQELVRGTEPGPDAAVDLDQAQATPGWLRYATVDADRRRTEQLDPATLVDRLANGLLRSLRGDPEDRSGRVRIQLARMAPEVQDSVLDRLELRLPVPVVDRLLEGVEETERSGPLPMEAAAAPLAVPGAAEEIEEERAREDSETDAAPGRDVRPGEPGKPGGEAQDGRSAPGGDREEDAGNQDGEGSASGDADQENAQEPAQGGAGSAGRQQEGSKDEQERSQGRQEDKDASGRDAEKDAADERKDASDTERDQQDQDKQDERDAEEDRGGPEDEAAQDPEKQAGEQERREDEGASEATRRQAPAPGTVDRSGAEPGEKSRTGGDTGTARAVGDPENEQDGDDEPLGLDAEPAQDDTEREAGDDTAGAAGAQPVPDADLVGYTDAAKNPNLVEERRKGTAPLPSPSSASEAPAPDAAPQEATPATASPDTAARSEDDEGSGSFEDLLSGTADAQQTDASGAGGALGAASPGAASTADTAGTERDRKQSDERKEDAEAARRDEEARTSDAAATGAAAGPGETAAPDQLAKSGEDARAQGAGSPSG
ncbi:eCIS core domain-containing protein, partial [Streptomyces sp. NPDC055506]